MIGTTLGAYRITAKLGEGGMGEVFRARDMRLNRDVAIKILPEMFAADAERVARFTREAQTLAALNHPHIAQIYGVEVAAADGTAGAYRGLVMELVEGEDLSERIARGPLPLDEALPMARQIAEALEAAHEQGIIHRDLKPGNIKLRPDGTVKVLDFGLAKALDRAPASGAHVSALQSPTITSPAMTLQGVILGTAAYMSPEQAKGRAADHRSDVWAFGCVLYEMLTARRAFVGEDVSDTLASVLRSEPDVSALPAETPSAIRLLVTRCLAKDHRRRVASLSTARFLIDEAAALASDESARPPLDEAVVRGKVQAAASAVRRALIYRSLLPALAVAALLAAALGYILLTSGPQGPAEVTRFLLSVGERSGTVLAALGRPVFALSNDGKNVVFASSRELWMRPLADFDARVLPVSDIGDSFVHSQVFSPDDRSIAFFGGGMIKRANVAGGATVAVCPAGQPLGMTWHAGGLIIGQGSRGILRCDASGGSVPEQLVKVEPDELAHGPQILPGDDAVLFTLGKMADGVNVWDKAEIVVQSLSSGQRTTVVRGGTDARYVPSGHLLYAVGGVVFAAPFDLKRLQTTGPPVAVIEGVKRSLGITGSSHFVTSSTGTLVYVAGPAGATPALWGIATTDRTAVVSRLAVSPGTYSHVRASRDGRQLAIGTDDGPEAAVWIHRLDGASTMRRLTLTGRNRFPVWLPDDQRVAFQSDRDGDLSIYLQRADGAGGAERLTKAAAAEAHIPSSWSPDGRSMLFDVVKDGRVSLWQYTRSDGQVTPFGGVESLEPTGAVFSPNGRWVAYASSPVAGGVRSPNRGVFVQPFPPTGATYQVPPQMFDFHPAWTPKGLELLYVPSATSGEMSAMQVAAGEGLSFGPRANFAASVTGDRTSGFVRGWDVLPDGRLVGIANTGSPEPGAANELRVVLNWFEELKQRAPLPR